MNLNDIVAAILTAILIGAIALILWAKFICPPIVL